ncbi:hypothetical protein [Streptomyces sp. NPDC005408]|uniref:hypothetical protein n=1 Tax=Streptomyces sp. NPDC005408 TaxID=3155341 RepID=UPI0033A37BAB
MTTIDRPAVGNQVRAASLAAMERLLAATPLRSSGRLSVSQLAVEAGIKRWHLTHQHLNLQVLFEARVKGAATTPKAFAKSLTEYEQLKDRHTKPIKHCAELEERLQTYAAAINLLALENAARTGQDRAGRGRTGVPLPRPEVSP